MLARYLCKCLKDVVVKDEAVCSIQGFASTEHGKDEVQNHVPDESIEEKPTMVNNGASDDDTDSLECDSGFPVHQRGLHEPGTPAPCTPLILLDIARLEIRAHRIRL